MNQLHVNILHRPERHSAKHVEGFVFQQQAVHALGIRSTIVVPFPTLFDANLVEMIKRDSREFGDEIGIWLGDFQCPEYFARFECNEPMFWLLPDEIKRGFAAIFLAKFKEVFGFMPRAIGNYIVESASLRLFKELAPEITVAVASCFEEGVNMFHGTRECWHLFNDGGPWSAWYPSKINALCPAANCDDDIGILAVPHLTRDMVLSILGRNDFFASHPPNMLRGKVYDGPDSAYHLNFIDQWIHQAKEVNGHGYYNIQVSVTWIIKQHFYEETLAESRQLYLDSLKHLARRRDEGYVVCETMSEYAAYHRQSIAYDRTEWCHWQEMLQGTDVEYVWAINPAFRAIFNLTQGGSIVDFRPYAGRLPSSTGSNEASLWFATYPYLVNTYLRHGMSSRVGRGSIFSTNFECNGKKIRLTDCKVNAQVVSGPLGRELRFADLTLDFNGVQAVVVQTIRVDAAHRLLTEWRVKALSESTKPIVLTTYFSGSVGVTEYPQDNRGTLLLAEGPDHSLSLVTSYAGIARQLAGSTQVSARMDRANTRLTIAGDRPAREAFLHDEPLFCPYFNIGLTHDLSIGDTLNLCLTLTKL